MDVLCLRGLQVSPARDFDRKVEIRAEKHEQLRRRTNVTSCRIPARDGDAALLKHTLKNKRQVEFMRRRSLPPLPVTRENSWFSSISARYSSSFSSPWSTSEWISRQRSLCDGGGEDAGHLVMMKMMVQDEACVEVIKGEKSAHEIDSVKDATHTPQQKMREASVQTDSGLVTIKESDILQLQDYMQEGLWREKAIKKKVAALQDCCIQLQNALNALWMARCSEDVLRNKIKLLETQLQTCLQRFPKEASMKLALQMKKQKFTFEEKIQKVMQEQNEDLSKTVTLMSFKNPDIQSQEALITAKTDVSRLQSLYEELNLTSQKLRQELEVSGKRAREQEAQIELSRGREATLTEELVSLRKEKNELLFHKSLQEEYYPFVKDQKQNLSDGSIERRDVSVQSTLEGEEASPTVDCDVVERLHNTQEELRIKEKECEALQTELHTMEQEFQSSQTRLSQCREELRQLGRHRNKATRQDTRWRSCMFLVLLLLMLLVWAVMGVAILQPWHPHFGEKLEHFYWDIKRRIENYFMQMASPKDSGCLRPV
ncbi:TRAF3-interacting JNK-activating modulator isoform X2 [Hippocampus comes]|uniref:TRAF3-interacting JNK-activating modulator isoform X2 n=1 Tax=Hippocampus comes TaxID=109280 RepID=UPI00094E843F|nr:PREDICTED: TRAF3-interacting JNK-activating modulator-like isoform X2 [Hippocampus comes]